ncbi:hypothetical protein WMO40_19505, partial [Bacillaceae bacterium CLA-AA-H227]
MKSSLAVILTILIETALLWGISIIFKWNLMEILFLGGVIIADELSQLCGILSQSMRSKEPLFAERRT